MKRWFGLPKSSFGEHKVHRISRGMANPKKMAQFRTHDVTKGLTYVSTQSQAKLQWTLIGKSAVGVSVWRTEKSHFQPSVEMGRENVDKNIDKHNKQ
jgi:hypothetical protein